MRLASFFSFHLSPISHLPLPLPLNLSIYQTLLLFCSCVTLTVTFLNFLTICLFLFFLLLLTFFLFLSSGAGSKTNRGFGTKETLFEYDNSGFASVSVATDSINVSFHDGDGKILYTYRI